MSSTVFYQLYIITISISFVYNNRLQKVHCKCKWQWQQQID